MSKLIIVIAGEPKSINSEIIAKTWLQTKNKKKVKIVVIGSFLLIKSQLKKLNIQISINKINSLNDKLNFKKLNILNVDIFFSNPYKVSDLETRTYLEKCFDIGDQICKKENVLGLVNCPVNKKKFFQNKSLGVTEYLSKKNKIKDNELMMIYNEKLKIVPITTHIKFKDIVKKVDKKFIQKKIVSLNKNYKKIFKKTPRILILGLNPHNDEFRNNSEEKKIILPAVKSLKRKRINIYGPLPADTAFLKTNISNFDVIVGLYHDQVLTPFKALFNFNAINITLGLPYIRVSPDHGTGENIIGKRKANPESLIKCVLFLLKTKKT